jgi:MFS family permease
LVGTARGFYSPAIQSLRPNLVPKEAFANASTWHTSVWQAGVILGPTMGGFLYAWWGLSATLLLVIAFVGIDILLLSLIKTNPSTNLKKEDNISIFTSFKEGFSFVYDNKILFYSISLDLVSVFFGGVIAILPIFAADVLHIGAEGLGILRASPSVGSLIALVLQAFYPPTKKAWRNMLIAIAGFGVFTLVFALSENLWLSCFALFLTGAFDAVSMVVRRTIVDVMTPENLRGRVNAVNGIFVSSSNELGAFESGVAAKLFGTVPSVLIGASCTLATVAVVWFKSKSLLDVDLNTLKKEN